jgi:hypothetical protein
VADSGAGGVICFINDGNHETNIPDVLSLFPKPRLRCFFERLRPKASFLNHHKHTSSDLG